MTLMLSSPHNRRNAHFLPAVEVGCGHILGRMIQDPHPNPEVPREGEEDDALKNGQTLDVLTISPPRVSCGRMIIYLCTKRNSETMASWLRTWGSAMADRLAIIHYEALTEYRSLPPAAYLFADLELLT